MTLTLPGPAGIGTGGGRACALWLPGDHWRGTIAVRRPTISPYYAVHALHAPRRFSRYTDIVVDRSQANVTHCSWQIRSCTRFGARARIENSRHTTSTSRGGQFNHLPKAASAVPPLSGYALPGANAEATDMQPGRKPHSDTRQESAMKSSVWKRGLYLFQTGTIGPAHVGDLRDSP